MISSEVICIRLENAVKCTTVRSPTAVIKLELLSFMLSCKLSIVCVKVIYKL